MMTVATRNGEKGGGGGETHATCKSNSEHRRALGKREYYKNAKVSKPHVFKWPAAPNSKQKTAIFGLASVHNNQANNQ